MIFLAYLDILSLSYIFVEPILHIFSIADLANEQKKLMVQWKSAEVERQQKDFEQQYKIQQFQEALAYERKQHQEDRRGHDGEEHNLEPFLNRLNKEEENNAAERETEDSSNLNQMYEID